MTHRAIRVALVLIVIAAIGGAAYGVFKQERGIGAIREDLDRVERDVRDLQVLGGDIRAAQQSYVAAGQGDAFWKERVTKLAARLDDELSDFERVVQSDEARTAIGAARAALDRFRKVDARARDYLQAGQHLLASDAIFADGIEAMTSLAGRIDAARISEISDRNIRVHASRRAEIWLLGGAAGTAMLVLLLLAPLPRTTVRARSDDGTGAEAEASESQELYITVPPAVRSAPPADNIDLASAAGLCTDLGRIVESRDLLPLLERAGALLGASGLVLWVADRSGAELRPVLSHGYADEVAVRFRAIPQDADNAAAAAYRTVETQIVRGTGGAHGAIVVPLITANGCVGVFAIETRNGVESLASVRSLATIVAAQLATMVGTDSPAAAGVAQAQAQA